MNNTSTRVRESGQGVMSSIRARLLLAFLLLSLIPLIAIGAISFFRSQSTITEQTKADLESTAHLQLTSLLDWLQARKNDATVFASLPEVQSLDPAQAAGAISILKSKWQIYESILLVGPDGNTIATDDGSSKNLADRQYIKDALAGQTVVSQPVVSKVTGNVIVVAAAPVYSNGKIVAVAAMTVPTSYISELLKAAQKGDTGEAYLINTDGLFLTPSRNDDLLKATPKFNIKNGATLELTIDTLASQEIKAGRLDPISTSTTSATRHWARMSSWKARNGV